MPCNTLQTERNRPLVHNPQNGISLLSMTESNHTKFPRALITWYKAQPTALLWWLQNACIEMVPLASRSNAPNTSCTSEKCRRIYTGSTISLGLDICSRGDKTKQINRWACFQNRCIPSRQGSSTCRHKSSLKKIFRSIAAAINSPWL